MLRQLGMSNKCTCVLAGLTGLTSLLLIGLVLLLDKCMCALGGLMIGLLLQFAGCTNRP